MQTVVVGEPLDRDALQMVQRHMRGVEIDRNNLRRIGRQIRKDVAAAAGNRGDSVARLDRQRLHIDDRVFPYLGIDQPLERERESAVEQALFLRSILADDSGGDFLIGQAGHARGSRVKVDPGRP